MPSNRRSFFKQAGLAAASAQIASAAPQAPAPTPAAPAAPTHALAPVAYPRLFAGRQLAQIAFPLGGVAAGSIALGGRGQLRDWEIFNRPDKGRGLSYAFPAIFVDDGRRKTAHVLEARLLPPFTGQDGLGARNAPGLTRLASAHFTGEYPLARIEFEDPALPVHVSLEAFSPFIPHEGDESGLPVAILRYRVRNAGPHAAVSIALSLENPVLPEQNAGRLDATRANQFRTESPLAGLFMTNPAMDAADPMHGSFALALTGADDGELSHLTGWPKGKWWDAPLLFWDDFSSDGKLGPETGERNAIGALCLSRQIAPGATADYTFLLAWHFPNRTPARCGWTAPKGDENTVIGNWYAARFPDAWAAALYAAQSLPALERKTRQFASALRDSTIPAALKDAASANLSTLASTTCFRTADGKFRGFEGSDDHRGCCFGNCTHVWNYETVTPHLFPAFARHLREAAFGYSMDDQGAIHFRTLLPEGKGRSGFAAADGQMGQIIHAYLDWKLSGDRAWLEHMAPRLRKAIEFAWIPGGWDANRDGVMEGVQHNTYDVEFYGPNPQCGVYYLAALRAMEEIALALSRNDEAAEYRSLREQGARWIDANLFNGEFYVQKTRGVKRADVAPALLGPMGSDDTENPQYQAGEGCLADQLIGQYLADVAALGPLLDPRHIRTTIDSIYRHNFKRTMEQHDTVQRVYLLNDEPGLVVCDYGKAERPRIPFPYYAEAWTGMEYSSGALMIYGGAVREGVECFDAVRRRFDGERRNPWNEPECGHHYARAMSAWSGLLAFSGFRYDAPRQAVSVAPSQARPADFRCFWSSGTGWGVFALGSGSLRLRVDHGTLAAQSFEWGARGVKTSASLAGASLRHTFQNGVLRLADPVQLKEGQELRLEVGA